MEAKVKKRINSYSPRRASIYGSEGEEEDKFLFAKF